MKTWEMIKNLTENPEKEFKAINTSGIEVIVKINNQGNLVFQDNNMAIFNSFYVNCEWEEVRKPVSFMEAWEHMKKGKQAECNGLKYILDGSYLKYWVGRDWYKTDFCKQLIDGEWHLLD